MLVCLLLVALEALMVLLLPLPLLLPMTLVVLLVALPLLLLSRSWFIRLLRPSLWLLVPILLLLLHSPGPRG